ncbi:MAG: hypothetical protein V4490_00755, partial [Pseudomonadota bacterium]
MQHEQKKTIIETPTEHVLMVANLFRFIATLDRRPFILGRHPLDKIVCDAYTKVTEDFLPLIDFVKPEFYSHLHKLIKQSPANIGKFFELLDKKIFKSKNPNKGDWLTQVHSAVHATKPTITKQA